MKKFTIMIFGVSMFFFGLGGMIRQLESTFRPDRQAPISETGLLPGGFEERINTEGPFKVKRRADQRIIISGVRDEAPDRIMEFNVRVPPPSEKTLSLPRHKSPELLTEGEPRPGRNVMVFQRRGSERPAADEEGSLIEKKIENAQDLVPQ